MKSRSNFRFLMGLMMAWVGVSQAQVLTVSGGGPVSANALVSNIIGTGVTFSNATYTGANVAAGTFNNGAGSVGLASGVILTTGHINVAPGPNNNGGAGFSNQGPQIQALNAIAQSPTRDGAILEFDFVPQSNFISFRYVFASEEYDEYVCSEFNDAFAFFISGPGIVGQENLAVVPATTIPITINTINNGNVGALGSAANSPCILGNSSYYVSNAGGTLVQYDGLTTVLTASRVVQACQTYHIKLMIADGFDDIFDSAVFLEENSFSSAVFSVAAETIFGDPTAIEGCVSANVTFSRPAADPFPLTINYTLGGTAIMGVDYNVLPGSITIPAGQTSAQFTITAIEDGLAEGSETVIINAITPCGVISTTVTIIDKPPLNLNVPNAAVCEGAGPALLNAQVSGGVSPYSYLWSTGASSSSISVSPTATTDYTVTVTDFCNTTATTTATVTLGLIPTASINSPPVACSDFPVTVNYTGTAPPSATYIWDFDGASNVTSGSAQGPYQVTWNTSGVKTISLQVIENGCASNVVTTQTIINPTPTADFVVDPVVCAGQIAVVGYTGTGTDGGGYGWGFPGGTIVTGGRRGPFQIVWDSVGTYGVSLTVTENGCTSPPFTVMVNVQPTPTADFVATSPVCVGENSIITYNGTATPTGTYNWNFSGGIIQSGSGAGPYTVSWNTSGVKNIFLTVVENGCASQVSSQQVTVRPLPTANFTIASPVCTGQPTTVTYTGNANAASTYNWNFGSAQVLSGSGQGPYQVVWNEVGTYQISLNVIRQGCQSPPVTQSATVFQTPEAPFTATSPVCAGEPSTIVYTGNLPNATFQWQFNGGQVTSGFGPGPYQVYWTAEGIRNVQLTVVSPQGCPSLPTTQAVTVLPTPTSIFTVTTPVCQDEAATITYTGTGLENANYVWDFNGGNVLSGSGQGPYQVSWPSPGIQNITVQVTQNGCISPSGTQQVLVKPRPTGFFTAQSPVCAFNPSELVYSGTSSANANFIWNFDNGVVLSGENGGPYQIHWETAGTKTVQLTVIDDGCASIVISNPVHVLPVPTSTFTATSPICVGANATITYTGNALPTATYDWDFGDAQMLTGSGMGPYQITYQTAGLRTVSLQITQNGCPGPVTTQEIMVYPIPTSPFVANEQVCLGQPATITYTGSGTALGSYNWNFNGGVIQSGAGMGPYSVIWNTPGPKIITLSLMENGCISPQTQFTVNVIPIPTSTFTATPLACEGQNSTITFTGQALPGATFNWNLSGGIFTAGTDPGPYQVTWNTTGPKTISLQVVQGGCPSLVSQLTLTVAPSPNAFAGPDTTLCPGDSIQLGTTANPLFSYQWLNHEWLSANNLSNPWLLPTNLSGAPQVQTYVLQTTWGGCHAYDTVQITVLPMPQVNFQLPQGQCLANNLFDFNTQALPGLSPHAQYAWSFGNMAVPATSQAMAPTGVRFLSAGLHWITLTVTDGHCASPVYSGQVEIFPMPQAMFSLNNVEGCPPLTVIPSNLSQGNGPMSYLWNYGNGHSGSTQNGAFTYHQSGTFTVSMTVTSADGCSATHTEHGSVKVYPKPHADFDINPEIVTTDNPMVNVFDRSIGAIYYWYNGGNGQSSQVPNPSFVYHQDGIYTITQIVENEFGCRDTAKRNLKAEPVITFYVPNAFTPNDDGTNDVFLCYGLNIKDFRMEIYNRWGQLVFESNDINYGWNGRIFNDPDKEISQMDVYAFVVYVKDTFDNPPRRIDGRVTLVK